MEEWRSIPGYEGMYAISNLGRIRSVTHGVKDDNHPGNLEWMTEAQNIRHAFHTGLNPGFKLSDDDVVDMRRAWDAGGETQNQLAARFNCSQATVSQVVNYKERAAPIHLPQDHS